MQTGSGILMGVGSTRLGEEFGKDGPETFLREGIMRKSPLKISTRGKGAPRGRRFSDRCAGTYSLSRGSGCGVGGCGRAAASCSSGGGGFAEEVTRGCVGAGGGKLRGWVWDGLPELHPSCAIHPVLELEFRIAIAQLWRWSESWVAPLP